MAKQAADKSKSKGQASDHKHKGKPVLDTEKEQKKAEKAAKAAKAAKEEAAAAALAAPVEKEPEAPRPPADPRLKFMKKFHGKFLPKGPLRDRLKALMVRWDSGEDHGDVTADELKTLFNDWKTVRTKPERAVKV
jgi:hypothetical protein